MGQAGDLGGAAGAADEAVTDSTVALTRAQAARQGVKSSLGELFSSHRDAASDAIGDMVQKPVKLASTAKGHVVRVANEATDRAQGAWDVLRNGQGGAPDQALAELPLPKQGIHVVPNQAVAPAPNAFDQALETIGGSAKSKIPSPLQVKAEMEEAVNASTAKASGVTSNASTPPNEIYLSETAGVHGSGFKAPVQLNATETVAKPTPVPASESPGLWQRGVQRARSVFSKAPAAQMTAVEKTAETGGKIALEETAGQVGGKVVLNAGAAAAGKVAIAEGTGVAAAEVVAKVATGSLAARLIGGAALRAGAGGLGAGLSLLPGAWDYGMGKHRHDDRQTTQGKVELAFAGGGTALGGLVGLLGGPPGVFLGATIGGGLGSLAGTIAATTVFKAKDAVTNTLSSAEQEIKKKVQLAKYESLTDDYRKTLSVSPTTNLQEAQTDANAALTAGAAVHRQLEAMYYANIITKEQGDTEFGKAKDEYNKFLNRINAGLEGVVTTPLAKPSAGKPVDSQAPSLLNRASAAIGGGVGALERAGSTLANSARQASGVPAAATHAGHTAEQDEYLKSIQRSLGLTGVDSVTGKPQDDAMFGHETKRRLVAAGLIKESDLPLADSKHAYASDEALGKLFKEHGAAIDAYVKTHPNGTLAPTTGTPAAAPAARSETPETFVAPTQPAAPIVRVPAIDERMQTALASLNKTDLEKMHPGAGPLHIGALVGDRKLASIDMTVNDSGGAWHAKDPNKLPIYDNVPAVSINILPEGGQRYTVTTADGTDVTGRGPAISEEAIKQAAREGIANIRVQEVGDHSFVFTPSRTPVEQERTLVQK